MKLSEIRLRSDWLLINIEDRGFGLTRGGLIVPDDDMKDRGIRARWARVLSVGPEVVPHGVEPGGYVLLNHIDWTRKLGDFEDDSGQMKPVWATKVEKVLLYDDSQPNIVGGQVSSEDAAGVRLGI